MNLKTKIFSAICVAAIAISSCCTSVFAADDYSFDLAKAKPTYGGGQAFAGYTRLDNEIRDLNRFNPLWMTEDSQIIIEYEAGPYETEAPIQVVFQSWTGKLVSGTENKWVQIAPTTFDENVATWDYQTLVDNYGDDFSDVYCIVIEDGGDNDLVVESYTITNVDVPEEEIAALSDGQIIRDGSVYTGAAETSTEESVAQTEIAEQSEEKVDEAETTTVAESNSEKEETSNETSSEAAESDAESNADANDETKDESSFPIGIVIAAVAGVAVIVVIVIIVSSKKKSRNHGWH